jgi:hypothetical protein
MSDNRNRIFKWAKIGAVVGVGIAILQMFTVYGEADVPVARTLGRLIGGVVIFGALGALLAFFQNLFSKNG